MTSLSVPTAAATQQSNWDCIWTGMWGDDDSGGHAGKLPGRLAALGKGRHGSGHGGVRALREGCQELLLCGCTGGRQDHHFPPWASWNGFGGLAPKE